MSRTITLTEWNKIVHEMRESVNIVNDCLQCGYYQYKSQIPQIHHCLKWKADIPTGKENEGCSEWIYDDIPF